MATNNVFVFFIIGSKQSIIVNLIQNVCIEHNYCIILSAKIAIIISEYVTIV